MANGELYLTGYNQGDYRAQLSLQRFIKNEAGTFRLGFLQSNRQPGFLFDPRSSFYRSTLSFDPKKENITRLDAEVRWKWIGLELQGAYYLVSQIGRAHV